MTFSTILLSISLVLISYLSVFGILFFAVSVLFFFYSKAKVKPLGIGLTAGRGPVTILIPSRDEGASLLDTVETLLHQDQPGPLHIQLLIEDARDTSVVFLMERFGLKSRPEETTELFSGAVNGAPRRVSLVQTSVAPKQEKLNFALKRLRPEDAFVGFLDADHRAAPGWISQSLRILQEQGSVAVQSRRMPLSISRLPQLWDSVQNHIGNEVLNTVLDHQGRSVFFTGTTAVFRADVFQDHEFSNCITEDTFLSYTLLTQGKHISYNPEIGSYEEVAPDYRSYMARRRRWSAGHTYTWFQHLTQIFSSNLTRREKIQLLIHGQIYLIPMGVILLLDLEGLFLFRQFTTNIQILILLLSAGASFFLGGILARQFRNFKIDTAVSFLWVFPQLSMLAVLFYRFFTEEYYYFLLSFPYAQDLAWVHLSLLLFPVLVVWSGYARFRNIRPVQFLILIPSYPVFLFLDIYAGALGFFDFLFRKTVWARIKRDNRVHADVLPEFLKNRLSQVKLEKFGYFWYWAALGSVVLIIAANDLLTFPNCGEPQSYLWSPLFYHPESPVQMQVAIRKSLLTADQLSLELTSTVTQKESTPLAVRFLIDGVKVGEESFQDLQHRYHIAVPEPLGWSQRQLRIELKGAGTACTRTHSFSTTVKEFKGQALLVNGEPFLIKGVVPSFSTAQIDLRMEEGLEQIKSIGANVIRFYHRPSDEVAKIAEKLNLLLIDQPDSSTWKNISLDNPIDRSLLKRRYLKLQQKFEGNPFSLFHHLGNELELSDKKPASIQILKDLMNELQNDPSSAFWESPLAYSTFFTFIPYPVGVLGLNTLDSGKTYWNQAVPLLTGFQIPFYASEYGGFVAHTERTQVLTRIYRMREQWTRLQTLGAFGAVFFESHDNWAQPVVSGYNDPFSPDMPDDTRGLWDEKNKPKAELHYLGELFADVGLEISQAKLDASGERVDYRAQLKNLRDYRLSGITLAGGFPETQVGSLEARGSTEIQFSLPAAVHVLKARANYTTHHGLQELSSLELNLPAIDPKHELLARVLNSNFTDGRLLGDRKLELVIPESWSKFKLNGNVYQRKSLVTEFTAPPLWTEVSGLQMRQDTGEWTSFDSKRIAKGKFQFRFKVDAEALRDGVLMLDGVGADRVIFQAGSKPLSFSCHAYRECFIDLKALAVQPGGDVTFEMERKNILYLKQEDSPTHEEVVIHFSEPRFFTPMPVVLERVRE